MDILDSNTGSVEYTAKDKITALREELTDMIETTSYKDKAGKVDNEWNEKKKEKIKTYTYEGLIEFKTMLERIGNKDGYVLLAEKIPGSNSPSKDITKPKSEPKSEPKLETKLEPKPEPKLEPKSELNVEVKAEGKKIKPWNKAIEKIFQKSELVPDLNNFTKEQIKTILEKYKNIPYSKDFWKKDEAYVLTLAIQYILGIEIDGKFGGNTLKSIQNFQKENKLKSNGAVGPKTIKAMLEKL